MGVGDTITNLAATAVSSIGLVAQNEFEAVKCRSIDLSEDDSVAALWIASEMFAGSEGDIAWRDGRRFESVLSTYGQEEGGEKWIEKSVDEAVELHLGT